jgi:hypothetical protein
LKAAYSFDAEAQVLKKFASETQVDEKNEFMVFGGSYKKVKPLKYETASVMLPLSGSAVETEVKIYYTVNNGRLILAEEPEYQVPHYEHFILNGVTDSVIIQTKDSGVNLVNLNDLSIESLNVDLAGGYLDTPGGVIFDFKILSVSPDNKYLLYFLNLESTDLHLYDMVSRKITRIMDFNKKDFLGWTDNSSDAFLYREKITRSDGTQSYSDIYKWYLHESKTDIFLEIDKQYTHYEMLDSEHIYAYSYDARDMNGVLYIKNIYTWEVKAAVLPRYTYVWNLALSKSKEYAGLCALFIDGAGNQVSRIITVYLETNDIRSYYELGYEVGIEKYAVGSFYWCPENVLIVNFINGVNLYEDFCRFHKVNHTKTNIPDNIKRIIEKDGLRYKEE